MLAMATNDDFSGLAREYARFRPTYPDGLFRFLASISPWHGLALDCGAGNGQAARGLVDYFDAIYAFDISMDQLKHAPLHPKISYLAARAEAIPAQSGSFDLLIVTEALHWFDLEMFYTEAKRVLKPGGILAGLAYQLLETSPDIDPIIARYYSQVLGPYWSRGVQLVDENYQTLPFPFTEMQPPELKMEKSWNLHETLGFLASWSATSRFMAKNGYHPLQEIEGELLAAWGDPDRRRTIHWPLILKVGVSQ
jgi:SAM-dependent methyltransferase